MTKPFGAIVTALFLSTITSCAFKRVTRSKNIVYLNADSSSNKPAQELNIFAPRNHASLKEVFLFIHGGTWNSGHKSMYSFLGNRMARKNVVTVIIDYPKSPQANYDEMASDAARAVKWVAENIKQYGGDPNKIFISGHSAGGHLAALVTVRNDYFENLGSVSPVKGAILIDAAGIDIYSYLKAGNYPDDHTYFKTFTNNPETWKTASPLYHLHKGIPPMLIYVGGKTYPFIKLSNEQLFGDLKTLGCESVYHLQENKKHKPMIKQFLYSGNPRYKEIIQFMRNSNHPASASK